ncbi:hypothetical protein Pmani_005550 [Petrolisthes manimaculis]|uniref:Chitin-binding type-2 domain-containing protein n=1 Tax=Petrolisthes manimaculis TaxID=1843537 RepID=A0AAE1UGK0_9EUCA|nr:hypothetical protein Pmani_005550 [Petrolisthes manimaculis]
MSRMIMVMMVVVWGGTLVTAGPTADAQALPEPKKNPNKRRPEGPITTTPTWETSQESNEEGLVAVTVDDNITVRIPTRAVPLSTRVTTPEDKDYCTQPEIFPDPVNCAAFSVCNPDPMGGSIVQKFTCTGNTVFFGTLLKCDTGSCLPVHYGSGTQSDHLPLHNPPMGTQSGPPAVSTPDWYNIPPSWLRDPPYWYNNPPSWFSQVKPAVKPPAVQEAAVHNPPRETPSGHMVDNTPDWYNKPPSWLREPPYWYNNPPSWFTQIRPAVKPPAVQEAAVHNPPREIPSGHTGGDGPDWYHIPPLWLREPPYWFNIPPDWYTQVKPLSPGQGGVLHNPTRGTPSGPPTDNTPDWYNRPPLWMRQPPYWYKTPPAWFTLGRPLLPDQGRVMHNPTRGTPSGPPGANTPDWYNRPPRWMREPPYWYNTPPAWFSSIRPRSMHDTPTDTTHDSSSSSSDQNQLPYQHRPAYLNYYYQYERPQ